MEENDFVAIWLEENGNPAIEEITQRNSDLRAEAEKIFTAQGLSARDLGMSLDIDPYEIERWLMGRHAFSLKVISEITTTLQKYSAKVVAAED